MKVLLFGLILLFSLPAEARPVSGLKGSEFDNWKESKPKEKSGFVLGGSGYNIEGKISEAIVILYTHGSSGDLERDKCNFRRYFTPIDQLLGNRLYPKLFRTLHHDNPRIKVFYVCHQETGEVFSPLGKNSKQSSRKFEVNRRSPCLKGSVNGRKDKGGLSKVCKRAQKIRFEVSRIIAQNNGLEPSQIILSGGSAGGWASLLLKAYYPQVAKAVIAFAPAATGKLWRRLMNYKPSEKERTKYLKRVACEDSRQKLFVPNSKQPTGLKWKWKNYVRQRCHQEFIAKHVKNALIFAYKGDPYNSPEMLPKFQEAKAGITFHSVPNNGPVGAVCGWRLSNSYPHACYQSKGFRKLHIDTVRKFIAKHLGN